ncbi:hypothetical protein Vadar_028958 [Vaccinium darrowii]|uniref:Uncharacterized protein n=1 Tax=Vaccinium darrowii TaxID=229202 RepID=A0ACB7YRG3_9ERIC|nr:hypothetical protein Vadar_028958 [Vaccinium darrowii]
MKGWRSWPISYGCLFLGLVKCAGFKNTKTSGEGGRIWSGIEFDRDGEDGGMEGMSIWEYWARDESRSRRKLEFEDDDAFLNMDVPMEDDGEQDESHNSDDLLGDINFVHSKISNEAIPKVDMKFMTEEAAYQFYNAYAYKVRFSVRRSKEHKDKSGRIVTRIFGCSCEGKRGKDKRDIIVKSHRPETRFGCLARMKIKYCRETKQYYVAEFAHVHNHTACTPSKTHLHRSHRKFSVAQAAQADMANDSGIAPRAIVEFMAREVGGRAPLSQPIDDDLWFYSFEYGGQPKEDLRQNYLTGTLSPSIGNLTHMQYLSVGINLLSGQVPKELGKLTDLRSLSLATNNFSGTLPLELGDLTNLEQLYITSSGVRGTIPSTFSSLKNLQTLRFQGNSFGGVIPSTFSKLTMMEDLKISDLSNGSSSLAFLNDMKSLSVLDLSYNELSGSFPSWVNQQDLQLNLVANNFTIEGSNDSVLPSGLSCLQRNFPCYRNSPIYYNLSVKCGGPQITSRINQIVYERDDEALGPASYYVTGTKRWVVSNVGRFGENNNARYTSNSSSQIADTLESELFQTARISAGSLRYYGLGLENGNYNVSLQFAEISILNPPNWRSLGRRVFDIYIQGNLVWKDFDLRKEAGGTSFQAVQQEFTAQVSENYLEIHLFWASKGTCCVPSQGTYGPSISAIIATPDFVPTVSNKPPTSSKKNKTGLVVGITVPVGVICFLSALSLCCFVRQKRRPRQNEDEEKMWKAKEGEYEEREKVESYSSLADVFGSILMV